MQERLQKIIAGAGIVSRRKAEELITIGRVSVNGVTIKKLGTKADPHRDRIEINGQLLPRSENKMYLMLNKPKGYVTTLHDPEGRPTVADLVGSIPERLYPAGRLDYDTEGLLILTNDGAFAHLLQHPRHNIARTYLVKVRGFLSDTTVKKLGQGVYLDGFKTGRVRIKLLRRLQRNSWLEVTIWEGKNRQLKRMFESIGHSTMRIIRVGFGTLKLDRGLKPGTHRNLTRDEIDRLENATASSQK
ncbi:MAG: pseudouridine synthase [Proteobacteria bacterium]|nr:pseudouridine synthase [Pseudomonadota bacterium]